MELFVFKMFCTKKHDKSCTFLHQHFSGQNVSASMVFLPILGAMFHLGAIYGCQSEFKVQIRYPFEQFALSELRRSFFAPENTAEGWLNAEGEKEKKESAESLLLLTLFGKAHTNLKQSLFKPE